MSADTAWANILIAIFGAIVLATHFLNAKRIHDKHNREDM